MTAFARLAAGGVITLLVIWIAAIIADAIRKRRNGLTLVIVGVLGLLTSYVAHNIVGAALHSESYLLQLWGMVNALAGIVGGLAATWYIRRQS